MYIVVLRAAVKNIFPTHIVCIADVTNVAACISSQRLKRLKIIIVAGCQILITKQDLTVFIFAL